MVMKVKKPSGKGRHLLILKATRIDGDVVQRGDVVPYPDKNGSLLCGNANKAVEYSEEALEEFMVEEERRAKRDAARKGGATTQGGAPGKPD